MSDWSTFATLNLIFGTLKSEIQAKTQNTQPDYIFSISFFIFLFFFFSFFGDKLVYNFIIG